MPRPRNQSSLRLFLSLTIGLLAVWGFIVAMVLIQLNTRVSRDYYYETLGVDAFGELVIDAYSVTGGVFRRLPRRYLSGKKDDVSVHELAPVTSLTAGSTPRPWIEGPIIWAERIMSTAETWYLVRDDAPQGSACIVGFDKESRLPVQYAGRNGFSMTPPDRSEHFQVGPPFGYKSPNVVSTSGLKLVNISVPGLVSDPYGTAADSVYVLDGDDLIEVDLVSRTVRTLLTLAGAQSMAIARQPIQVPSLETTGASFQAGGLPRRHPMAARLAIRTRTSVVIVDLSDASQNEFKLPDELHTAQFNLYALSPEKILIDREERDSHGEVEHHLTWIETGAGEIKRQTITTHGSSLQNMRSETIVVAAVMPMLALFIPSGLGLMPSTLLQSGAATTLDEAYRQMLSAMWPAALGLAILSLIAAYLVLRWERKHGRPHPWRWAVATFLLGIPGFIAYILLHGRKSLAAPRRERPATPALLGTELFA